MGARPQTAYYCLRDGPPGFVCCVLEFQLTAYARISWLVLLSLS